MFIGDTVYYKTTDGNWVRYIVKKKENDELIVFTALSHLPNWVFTSDVVDVNDFIKRYNGEIIYE